MKTDFLKAFGCVLAWIVITSLLYGSLIPYLCSFASGPLIIFALLIGVFYAIASGLTIMFSIVKTMDRHNF